MKLLVALSVLFISISSHATSPKQVCRINKDLKTIFVGISATAVQAEITYDFYVNMQGATAVETKTVNLTFAQSLANENVSVFKSTFKDNISSSLYVRGLKSVKTSYFSVSNSVKTLLFEETETPVTYYQGQEMPLESIVCFEYAN